MGLMGACQKYDPLCGMFINVMESAKYRFRDDLGGGRRSPRRKAFGSAGAGVDRGIDATYVDRDLRG